LKVLKAIIIINARRVRSSYNLYSFFVISPAVAKCCSRLCTDNISKCLVLYQNLQFFPISKFLLVRMVPFSEDDWFGNKQTNKCQPTNILNCFTHAQGICLGLL